MELNQSIEHLDALKGPEIENETRKMTSKQPSSQSISLPVEDAQPTISTPSHQVDAEPPVKKQKTSSFLEPTSLIDNHALQLIDEQPSVMTSAEVEITSGSIEGYAGAMNPESSGNSSHPDIEVDSNVGLVPK